MTVTDTLAFLYNSVFSLSGGGLTGCNSKPSKSNQTPEPEKAASVLSQATEALAPTCAYRLPPPNGQPFDYYLWQNGALCQDRGERNICNPGPPESMQTPEEIDVYEHLGIRPVLSRLPQDESDLATFLLESEQAGMVVHLDDANCEVYDILEAEINAALPGQDIHFVFGLAHGVEGQTAFFNELLEPGADGRQVNGVTHLALEMARQSSRGLDLQRMMDYYLVYGQEQFRPNLRPRSFSGMNMLEVSQAELTAKVGTFTLAYEQCYNLVQTDLPSRDFSSLYNALGMYHWLATREAYAATNVLLRQDPGARDIVFWKWGASHAEQYRLPYHIRLRDPNARVVSMVMNGGTYLDALAFDRALEQLGWLEQSFVLALHGYREANYIVHIPTEGRERLAGISRATDPVVQHIFDRPQ